MSTEEEEWSTPEGRALAKHLLGDDEAGAIDAHFKAIDLLLENLPRLVDSLGFTPEVVDGIRARLPWVRQETMRMNPNRRKRA